MNIISYLFPPVSILMVRAQKKMVGVGMFVKLNMSDVLYDGFTYLLLKSKWKQSLPRWEAHIAHVEQGERFGPIKITP